MLYHLSLGSARAFVTSRLRFLTLIVIAITFETCHVDLDRAPLKVSWRFESITSKAF